MNVGMYILDETLGRCVIVFVHRAGTIDVLASNGRYYRLSGMEIVDALKLTHAAICDAGTK